MGEFGKINANPEDISGNIIGATINIGTSDYSNAPNGIYLSSGNNIGTFRSLLYTMPAQIGVNESILRRWKMESDYPPTNRNLTFSWNYSEDNGNSSPNLQVWKSEDEGSSWFAQNNPTSATSNPRNITLNDITGFSDWTVADSHFELAPSLHDFGDVAIGSSVSQQFVLDNTTSSNIRGYIITYGNFLVEAVTRTKSNNKNKKDIDNQELSKNRNNIYFNISSGATKDFNVIFEPTDNILYEDIINIRLLTTNNPQQNFAVSGTGYLPPDIDISPDSLYTELEQNETDVTNLRIYNFGDVEMTYDANISYTRDERLLEQVYPINSSYNTGSCTNTTKTETSLVKGYNLEDGWMKFDISSIPDNAIIDSVRFHGFVDSTNYPYWSITPVSNDPVTTDAATLNADIIEEALTGYYFYKNEASGYSPGWKTHLLEGSANSDLESSLVLDWFAIGMVSRDNSTSYYINFQGWNESNPPYLDIFYSVPSYNWLSLDGSSEINGILQSDEFDLISVGFDSANLSDDLYSATIIINSNDPNEPTVDIPADMFVATPGISVDQTDIAFGDVIIGNNNSEIFNIENTGTAELTGTIITPTDFSVIEIRNGKPIQNRKLEHKKRNSLNFNILGGQNSDFQLTFAPLVQTAYDVQITIQNNAGSDELINVTGNGIGIDITVNPVDFEKTLMQNTSILDTLEISTSGNGTLQYNATVQYSARTRNQLDVFPSNSSKWTGSCNSTNFTDDSIIRCHDQEDGWMMFDISAIPNDATIYNVEFNGFVNATDWPYWSITPVTSNPLTTDAATLHTDIIAEEGSGFYLFQSENSGYSIGWKQHQLIGSAEIDLQNALTQDWFTIGITSRDNNPSYYIIFDGWDQTNSPYLTVEYALSGEEWILLNNELSISGSVVESIPEEIELSFNADQLDINDYSATIVITSNDPDESEKQIPILLHVIETLISPENVIIEVVGTTLTLTWDDSGANSYKIYESDSPNGTFSDVTSQGSIVLLRSTISWQKILDGTEGEKFYKVTSSNE